MIPTLEPAHAASAIEHLDGLLLSGGNDIDPSQYGAAIAGSVETDPQRDAWEIALFSAARAASVPVLGICRGAQLINVACGGTLNQHVWDGRADHPDLSRPGDIVLEPGSHEIVIEPESRLAQIYGTQRRTVNSFHHQAIDVLGDGLLITATAPDGTVEGIESEDGLVVAVQWHPERMDSDEEKALFQAFVIEVQRLLI